MSSTLHPVRDFRSNKNDNIVDAANEIGNSDLKRKVFHAVYSGKKAIKTVQYIADKENISRKAVLDTAKKLAGARLIHQTKHGGDTAYRKDADVHSVWKKILSLAGNKSKIDKIPTKVKATIASGKTITIKIPQAQAKIKAVTIDDIDSFSRVRKIKNVNTALAKIPETKFKHGILKILSETGKPPKDWGGEKNDIYTTKLKMGGKRYHAAFALKGPGQKVKKLTPKHMGKNGDQIQRLHRSSAQVFFVQYWGEIDESVIDLMEPLSLAKSYSEGRSIYFGIINGEDSARLMQAYPAAFK